MAQTINKWLGKKKSAHRWGVLSFLFKDKTWKKLPSGVITNWEEIKWRTITTYHNNIWRQWYSLAGQTLSLLALLLYPLCDTVQSTGDIQRKLRKLNALLEIGGDIW